MSETPLHRFAAGFVLPLRGIRLVLSRRELRAWSLAIAAVTALALVALLAGLLAWTGDLLGLLWPRPGGAMEFLWWPAAVLLFGLLLLVGATTLPALITAPLADPLVAATERVLGRQGPEGGGLVRIAAETLNALAKTALRIGILLAGHALLLILWVLPGAGHAAWTVLSLLWTLFWLAFEYLDLPANRYGYRFREVARAVGANVPECLGFALAVYALLWVPVVNAFFIPAAVVGATLLFVELRASGRMVPSREELRAAIDG